MEFLFWKQNVLKNHLENKQTHKQERSHCRTDKCSWAEGRDGLLCRNRIMKVHRIKRWAPCFPALLQWRCVRKSLVSVKSLSPPTQWVFARALPSLQTISKVSASLPLFNTSTSDRILDGTSEQTARKPVKGKWVSKAETELKRCICVTYPNVFKPHMFSKKYE